MKKIIAHVDADCFYVSCERIRDKSLLGRAVGVLGNQGACVIAKSYEMKACGVKTGMPIWEAKKLCPEAIYVKRDFEWYGSVSYAMQEILKNYSDAIEYYSIDESFLDLSGMNMDMFQTAKRMQLEIKEKLDLPVSVGISHTRTLAKIASEKNKPRGLTVVKEENLQDFLCNTDVSEISGIGSKLAHRLYSYGIKNCGQYIAAGRRKIREILNKPGEEIWYELQGKSLLPVRTVKPLPKMVSRGGGIAGNSSDLDYIYAFLVRNLERLHEALWRYRIELKNFSVILQNSEGCYFTKQFLLPDYSSDFEQLLYYVKAALNQLYSSRKKYRAVFLMGTDICSKDLKQLNLFNAPDLRKSKFNELKNLINNKLGNFVVRSAATESAPMIYRDVNSNYEITDIYGKYCF